MSPGLKTLMSMSWCPKKHLVFEPLLQDTAIFYHFIKSWLGVALNIYLLSGIPFKYPTMASQFKNFLCHPFLSHHLDICAQITDPNAFKMNTPSTLPLLQHGMKTIVFIKSYWILHRYLSSSSESTYLTHISI